MSKLDEMIRELCPDGVEYVKLGTLCSLITKQTGFDYTNHIKARLLMEPAENAVPYIQTKFFAGKNFNYQTDYYVPMDIVEQFPKITLDEKCILFSIVGASIGNVGLFPGERKCFLGGAICVAKVLPQYDVDYVYYCVESHNVQHQIRRKTKGAGQATITVEDIREFEIPLPPIEIQSEIVHTLDNYTENVVKLQNQLTAELTARQKQYTFYRNKLLTFSGNEKAKIVKISLGDIGPICMCKRILKSQTNTVEGVPFYKIGTLAIKHAGGKYDPKPLHKIVAGLLTTTSDWAESSTIDNIANNLSENELKRLDMICCVAAGTFVCDRGDKTISYCDKSKSLVYFLLKVLGKLQEIGTVPAIDYNAYAQKIEVHQHP